MNKDFVTAGRAIFTLEVPEAFQAQHKTKPHYTFKVRFKKASGTFKDAYFVNLLTGPDNTEDYTYVGMLDKDTGAVRLTAKSCLKADDMAYKLLCRALGRVWANEAAVLEQHGFKLHHMGQCGRCARPLTTPESVERGIGPECWKHVGPWVTPTKKATHGTPVCTPVDDEEGYEESEYNEPDPAEEAERQAVLRAYGNMGSTGP